MTIIKDVFTSVTVSIATVAMAGALGFVLATSLAPPII